MSDTTQSITNEHLFEILCNLARLSATYADLYTLFNDSLNVCLEHLPIEGALVWLRSSEQDMFTPACSRLPQGCSTSAISEDNALLQQIVDAGYMLLQDNTPELIVLPEHMVIGIATIESEDTLLGLVGYVGTNETIETLSALIMAHADVLSGPIVSDWLRRQHAEADDVTNTLFSFADELRSQSSLEAILSTLNNLALRVFNCDWAAVYAWTDDPDVAFQPVQIVTRVATQPIDEEPSLILAENPILELVLNDSQPYALRDLREQPTALPVCLERHDLRGLVVVPIKHDTQPMGLLILGYRSVLIPLSSRSSALAQGLAHMVAVALERTDSPS